MLQKYTFRFELDCTSQMLSSFSPWSIQDQVTGKDIHLGWCKEYQQNFMEMVALREEINPDGVFIILETNFDCPKI